MAIRSETRTTHTITIDLPDDVLGKIEYGDDVEIIFQSMTRSGGRMPRAMKVSWGWTNYIMGWNK